MLERRRALLTMVAAVLVLLLAPVAPSRSQGAVQVLAPTGTLRVGVYEGSPLSMVTDRTTVEARGLSVDLGDDLGRRLGVPVRRVVFRRIADVLQAMKAGEVDVTVSNATPARAQDVDFSPTLLSLKLGFLVPAGSAIAGLDAVDRPGTRVGVVQGSTSERALPRVLQRATVVNAPDVKVAVQMFAHGELDAFGTNKPILFEMSDEMPGSRVLDGRWGVEHVAVAIPKGRAAGMETVRALVAEVQSDGSLDRAIARAGLRGSVKAE